MTAIPNPRKCLSCDKNVIGRADKKFCNDYCRNEYNNAQKADTTNLMRNINAALAKNRRIMQGLFAEGEEIHKVHFDKLQLKGFSLKYFTHTYTNKKGQVYFFCYDTGYLPLENNWFLLVKRKEE